MTNAEMKDKANHEIDKFLEEMQREGREAFERLIEERAMSLSNTNSKTHEVKE